MFSDHDIDQDVIVSQHAHDRAVQRLGLEPKDAWDEIRSLYDFGRRISPGRLPSWFRKRQPMPMTSYILCSRLGQEVVLVLKRIRGRKAWVVATVVGRYCALSGVPA